MLLTTGNKGAKLLSTYFPEDDLCFIYARCLTVCLWVALHSHVGCDPPKALAGNECWNSTYSLLLNWWSLVSLEWHMTWPGNGMFRRRSSEFTSDPQDRYLIRWMSKLPQRVPMLRFPSEPSTFILRLRGYRVNNHAFQRTCHITNSPIVGCWGLKAILHDLQLNI